MQESLLMWYVRTQSGAEESKKSDHYDWAGMTNPHAPQCLHWSASLYISFISLRGLTLPLNATAWLLPIFLLVLTTWASLGHFGASHNEGLQQSPNHAPFLGAPLLAHAPFGGFPRPHHLRPFPDGSNPSPRSSHLRLPETEFPTNCPLLQLLIVRYHQNTNLTHLIPSQTNQLCSSWCGERP